MHDTGPKGVPRVSDSPTTPYYGQRSCNVHLVLLAEEKTTMVRTLTENAGHTKTKVVYEVLPARGVSDSRGKKKGVPGVADQPRINSRQRSRLPSTCRADSSKLSKWAPSL